LSLLTFTSISYRKNYERYQISIVDKKKASNNIYLLFSGYYWLDI